MAKQQISSSNLSAAARKAAQTQGRAPESLVTFKFPFATQNFLFLAIGIGGVILGYVLMSTASGKGAQWDSPLAITIAPIILVVSYLILIPLAIFRKKDSEQQNDQQS